MGTAAASRPAGGRGVTRHAFALESVLLVAAGAIGTGLASGIGEDLWAGFKRLAARAWYRQARKGYRTRLTAELVIPDGKDKLAVEVSAPSMIRESGGQPLIEATRQVGTPEVLEQEIERQQARVGARWADVVAKINEERARDSGRERVFWVRVTDEDVFVTEVGSLKFFERE